MVVIVLLVAMVTMLMCSTTAMQLPRAPGNSGLDQISATSSYGDVPAQLAHPHPFGRVGAFEGQGPVAITARWGRNISPESFFKNLNWSSSEEEEEPHTDHPVQQSTDTVEDTVEQVEWPTDTVEGHVEPVEGDTNTVEAMSSK